MPGTWLTIAQIFGSLVTDVVDIFHNKQLENEQNQAELYRINNPDTSSSVTGVAPGYTPRGNNTLLYIALGFVALLILRK